MNASIPIPGPLGLGDILDRAFRLYRARFGPMLLAGALFLVPMSIITTYATRWYTGMLETTDLASIGQAFLYLILALVCTWLFGGMAVLTLISYVQSMLQEGAADVRASVGAAWSRLGAYLGYTIAYGFFLVLVGIVAMIPMMCSGLLIGLGAGGSSTAGGALLATTLLMAALFVIPLLYVMARWIVAAPALVIEGQGPVACLRRSWGLTQGNVWRCVGYAILITVLGYLVMLLPELLLSSAITVALGPGVLGTAANAAFSTAFSVLWQPAATAALVLLYFDLRVRREDYDLALRVDEMAAAVGAETGAPAAVRDEEPVYLPAGIEPAEEPVRLWAGSGAGDADPAGGQAEAAGEPGDRGRPA